MNVTLDDSDSALVFSSNWAVQPSNATDLYYQSTYHVALADGANVNLTSSGSDIYIYGSKGPEHAQYAVYCDESVRYLSAFAPETQYRRLLFNHTFANATEDHPVTIIVHMDRKNRAFDIDYVTATQDPVQAPPAPAPPSPPQIRHVPTPTIIGAAFGGVLGTALLILAALLALRWRRHRAALREHAFRYGIAARANPSKWSLFSASTLASRDTSGRLQHLENASGASLAELPTPARGVLFGFIPRAAASAHRRGGSAAPGTDFLQF